MSKLRKIKRLDPVSAPVQPELTIDAYANTLLVQRWKDNGTLSIEATLKPYDSEAGYIDWSGRSGVADVKISITNAWDDMQDIPALAELAAAQVAVIDMFAEEQQLAEMLAAAKQAATKDDDNSLAITLLQDKVDDHQFKMETISLAELVAEA